MAAYQTITNCTFLENLADQSGGAIYLSPAPRGYTYSGAHSLQIRDTWFGYNFAGSTGGAISQQGLDGTVHVSGCTFLRNVANLAEGGAVEARASGESSLLIVEESAFVGCMAYAGGAVFLG